MRRQSRAEIAIVCLDLDGVLAEEIHPFDPDRIGLPLPGALAFVRYLQDGGCRIIVHTCRAERDPALVQTWLDRHDFTGVGLWTGRGKPWADAYVDDRAVLCQPAEDSTAYDFARVAVGRLIDKRLNRRGARR